MTEFVDGLVGYANDIDVDDRATLGSLNDVDHASQERLLGVTGHDENPRPNPIRLRGFVEKRPDIAGFVDLLNVGRQRDTDGAAIVTAASLRSVG